MDRVTQLDQAMWTAANRGIFAAEVGRAMSRGFDYRLLAEGIHDEEEGE